eukprot:gene12864-15723_t
MSTPVISGDGIFSHVFIGAADVQKSAAFYDAALGALGIKNLGPFGDGWVLFGREKPAFIIARPVDAFHAAGLTAGGTDEGQPGPRGHLPGAYAAYLRDPAGNKVCSYTFV